MLAWYAFQPLLYAKNYAGIIDTIRSLNLSYALNARNSKFLDSTNISEFNIRGDLNFSTRECIKLHIQTHVQQTNSTSTSAN